MIEVAPTIRVLAASIAVSCLLAACGGTTAQVKPADDIYAAANSAHEDESYSLAIEQYKMLLDQYPLDPRAEEIELKIAKAHYADESYPEAIAAFADFQRMHPTSPALPEVEFTIGQAYMDQMSTIDRDLSNASNATARFEAVATRYPRSEYAEKAKEKLHETREHLAAREFYVADFYYKRGKTRAARGRIIEVLVKYPETDAAREATQRVMSDATESDDAEILALAEAALLERKPEGAESGAPLEISRKPGPATSSLIAGLRQRQERPAVASGPDDSPSL